MIELLIQNTTDGRVFDVRELVQNISWSTERVGKPGELTFMLLKKDIDIVEGSIVRFKYKKTNVFYGYIFVVDENKNEYSIKAFDQMRYLLNKDTYVFKNVTADQVLNRIATDFKLKVSKNLLNTEFVISSLIEDNQSLLDMILKSLDLTLINTGEMLYLYDDFGELNIANVRKGLSTLLIGDDSLLTDFKYKRDIEQDTFNKIKLVKNNKTTGKRDVYIAKDSSNIAKWGILQYYEKINEDLNDSQIRQRLEQLAKTKNRVLKRLTLNCIGDISVRAGTSFFVRIGSINLNTRLLVDSVKHNFDNGQHTMELEMRVI